MFNDNEEESDDFDIDSMDDSDLFTESDGFEEDSEEDDIDSLDDSDMFDDSEDSNFEDEFDDDEEDGESNIDDIDDSELFDDSDSEDDIDTNDEDDIDNIEDDSDEFDIDDSDFDTDEPEDDLDDFFSDLNNNTSQRQGQNQSNVQKRQMTSNKIFLNNTKRGEQTQQMFNFINGLFGGTAKLAAKASKSAKRTVVNGAQRINNSSYFNLDSTTRR